MPVDPALLDLMTHGFDWRQKTGQDAWQVPSFAPAVPVRGYHVEKVHEVTDATGVKRVARGTVWLDDVYGVKPGDELLWCGESLGEIIQVVDYFDEAQAYGSEIHHG